MTQLKCHVCKQMTNNFAPSILALGAIGYTCRACDSARVKKRYHELKSVGLCAYCGKVPKEEGSHLCVSCRARGQKAGRKHQAKRRVNARAIVFNHYGEKCQCCGENETKFLAIDHINEDGADHRRRIPCRRSGATFYMWVVKQGFPANLQLLCHNCNMAKHMYGVCPHMEVIKGLFIAS